jgi:glucokinase
MLAIGITNYANVFRPEAVVLGGGVCAQGDNLIKPLQKLVDRDIYAGDLGPRCQVKIATLENNAGILGAVALVINK